MTISLRQASDQADEESQDVPPSLHRHHHHHHHRRGSDQKPLMKALLVILVVLCLIFAVIAIILAVKISQASVVNPQPGGSISIPIDPGDESLLAKSPDQFDYAEANRLKQTSNGQRVALIDNLDLKAQGVTVKTVMTCGNQACLDLALYLHKTVNRSAPACSQFYDFACGNWPVKDTSTANSLLGQVMQSIDQEVQSTLENILMLPHGQRANGRNVAEQQVVNFYDACTNVTTREKLSSKPLIDLLDAAVSPCYLFGAPDLKDWNPVEAWKRTFRDFGVEVIFSIHVQVPPETEGPVWIVVAPRSPQLGSLVDSKEGMERARDVLFDIGQKLSTAAGVSRPFGDPFDYGLSNFVQDTLDFTQFLAQARREAYPLVTMTPADFVSTFKDATASQGFNPTNYFEEFFRNASTLTVSVPINVDAGIQPFIKTLGKYMQQNKDTWKRRFNNYLTTEIILHYMLEISGDYERHLASFFPKSYNRFYSKSYSVETRCRNEAEFTFKDIVYEMLANKRTFNPEDLPIRMSRNMFVSAMQNSKILNMAQIKVLMSKLHTSQIVNQSNPMELRSRYSAIGISATNHFQNVIKLQRMRYAKLMRLLTGREGPGDRWDNFLRSTSFAAYAGDSEKAFYINSLLFRQPLFDPDWPAEFNIARSAGVHYQLLKSMMLPYLKRETNSTLFRNYRSAIMCYQNALASVRFTAPVSQAVNFALLFNSVNTSLRFLAANNALLKKTSLDYAIPGFMVRPPQLTMILAAQPFCRKDISDEQRSLVHHVFTSLPDFSKNFGCRQTTTAGEASSSSNEGSFNYPLTDDSVVLPLTAAQAVASCPAIP